MMSCSYPPHFMMESKNTALREALEAAKVKLQKCRKHHGGEYVGGMEHTALIKMINKALEPNANT